MKSAPSPLVEAPAVRAKISMPKTDSGNPKVPASAQPNVPAAAGMRTLLYVEDNLANVKLIEQIIAGDPDVRMLTAVNGKSGIEIARASRPEVILMDINLPDINGFKALTILRSDPATARIPVIAISGNALPLNVESGLEAGFFRYLTKPIKVGEFVDALNAAMEFARKKSDKSRSLP
jgi:CheY-like chemotaxis protein